MSAPQLAEIPREAMGSALALLADHVELKATVRELLELHIAHHNHPTHAAARALLRRLDGLA